MDNLWVQAGLIVAAQCAIAYAAWYRSHRQQESHKQKIFSLWAVKYNVTTAEAEAHFDDNSEEALRYVADYLSPEKWENRFADFVGLLFKPLNFIFAIASWGQLVLVAAALFGAMSAEEAVLYCWFVTAGIFAQAIIGAALDIVTYAITGRAAGGPANARKQFAEVWDQHLAEKNIAERIELNPDWEFA